MQLIYWSLVPGLVIKQTSHHYLVVSQGTPSYFCKQKSKINLVKALSTRLRVTI